MVHRGLVRGSIEGRTHDGKGWRRGDYYVMFLELCFPPKRWNWSNSRWPAAGLNVCGSGRKRASSTRCTLLYAKWLHWGLEQRLLFLWFLGIFAIVPVMFFFYVLNRELG
jgi:hypothetical protein